MGDIRKNIRKNMKSKAEAAAICCCCLLRYQADNTLRRLTAVGLPYRSARTTAQLRRNAKVLALRKRLRKSGTTREEKRALPLNSSLPLKIAQNEKCSL